MTDAEHIQQLGQRMLATIEEVRQKTAERDRLLSVLEMQAMVMSQGIDVRNVKSYGYDPLTDKRKPMIKDQWRKPKSPVYNYLIMKDGTRIDMEPVPVPRVEGK